MGLYMPFSIANYEAETLARCIAFGTEWSDFEQAGHAPAADTLVLRTLMAKRIMSEVRSWKLIQRD